MKKNKNPFIKIGILGGGQLARMLIQAGQKIGLEMHVLCPMGEEPAAQVTRHWSQGHPENINDLKKFMKKIDILTFESEFIDTSKVLKAKKKIPTCKVEPHLKIMEILQDRWSQKNLLIKYKIPTASFIQVSKKKDLDIAFEKFPKGFVLKRKRFGYDGNGTFIFDECSPGEHHHPLSQSPRTDFFSLFDRCPEGFIAEEKIPFKREFAIQVGRSLNGQFSVFPLVESKQKEQKCFWIKGPVYHQQQNDLIKNIKKLLQAEKYVGLIAFELFETSKGLLVNEVAPRVHNSGHYSLDALSVDQFTMHLKCITGMRVAHPLLIQKGFAMLNLLGKSHHSPQWSLQNNIYFHWYGKTENRPGRKMGHLNALDASAQQALRRLLLAEKDFYL